MSTRRIGARTALVAAGVLVSVALMAAPSWAEKGGNSANAKLCQKGKWETLVNGANHLFKSEEECASYGAEGGTPQPGKPDLTLSPGTLDSTTSTGWKFYNFSHPALGSWTQTFTVTNGGTGTANGLRGTGLELQFTQRLSYFALSSDTCTGHSLVPKGTCSFTLSYNGLSSGPESAEVELQEQENSYPYISLNTIGMPVP